MLRFRLWYWLLGLEMLGGCQSKAPAPTRITAANYLTAIPDPKTLGETYVSDPDTILPPGAAPALNARLDSLDRSGRAHIDVVLVRSLGTAVPKQAATALFNKWKIGSKATNNGLLMLLVLDQRRVEFETGYGLEADLPDIICYRIQQRYMVEPARAGDYYRAVQQGVAAIIRHLRPPAALPKPVLRTAADSTQFYVDSLKRAIMAQSGMLDDEDPLNTALPGEALTPAYYTPPEPGPEPAAAWLLATLTLVLYLVLWHHTTRGWAKRTGLLLVPFGVVGLLLLLALGLDWPATAVDLATLCYALPLLYLTGYFGWRAGQRRAGGAPQARADEYNRLRQVHHNLGYTAWLFPLPLAGYWWWHERWLHRLRHVGLACPTCGQPLRQVVGEAAAAHLTPGQQAEEKIESVAYDAWACPSGHALTLAYPNPGSPAQPCPACHFRTFTERREQPVQAATARAAGWGWEVAQCHFCQHERKRKYAIARLATPTTGSSGSGSGSSWGGSSGGSSSGSPGSTSSGGSSGGGGTGSSW